MYLPVTLARTLDYTEPSISDYEQINVHMLDDLYDARYRGLVYTLFPPHVGICVYYVRITLEVGGQDIRKEVSGHGK